MNEHFPYLKSFGRKVRVRLDLSNYPKKADLQNATVVDTSDCPGKNRFSIMENLMQISQIPNVSNLVKKKLISETENEITTDHDHDEYITTQEFNKLATSDLTSENFAARLAEANLSSKNDISKFVRNKDFDDQLKNLNKKVTSNKTKHVQQVNVYKVQK